VSGPVDIEEVAGRYLRLGLRAGRLRAGLVDSYTGPDALRRHVEAEPVSGPAELAGQAAVLRRELDAAVPAPSRRDFLDRQLVALECSLRELAGERIAFPEQLRAYFDTEVDGLGEPDSYRAAHVELAQLLPGRGSLASRMVAYRERERVPTALLGPAVQALSARLRELTAAAVGLPDGEAVFYELVSGRPWSGLTQHLGGHHRLVAVNTDAGPRAVQLARLVAHEAYPGHHTEYCRAGPSSQPERALHLVNTPRCVISEGLAEAGLVAAVGPEWGRWTASVLAGLGLRMDGELAQRVERVVELLGPVRQDAALLLHDRAADPGDVVEYLRRWLLLPERRARQVLRFLVHPLWRAYTTSYLVGYPLVLRWLADRDPDEPALLRHQRLLDQPWTPSALDRSLPPRSERWLTTGERSVVPLDR
jgi:hypothetical protein